MDRLSLTMDALRIRARMLRRMMLSFCMHGLLVLVGKMQSTTIGKTSQYFLSISI